MGDGGAIGRLPLGPFTVYMNPLAIVNYFSELLNVILGNRKPLGRDLTPDQIAERLQCFYYHGHWYLLSTS